MVFREGQPGTLDSGSPAGLDSHDHCSAIGQLPKHTGFPYLQKGGGGRGSLLSTRLGSLNAQSSAMFLKKIQKAWDH